MDRVCEVLNQNNKFENCSHESFSVIDEYSCENILGYGTKIKFAMAQCDKCGLIFNVRRSSIRFFNIPYTKWEKIDKGEDDVCFNKYFSSKESLFKVVSIECDHKNFIVDKKSIINYHRGPEFDFGLLPGIAFLSLFIQIKRYVLGHAKCTSCDREFLVINTYTLRTENEIDKKKFSKWTYAVNKNNNILYI